MSEKSSKQNIGAILLEYMEKHPDETQYRGTIASSLGLTEDQVKSNMYGLWYRDVNGAASKLEIIMPGNAWRWRSALPADRTESSILYSQKMITKNGTIIVESEDGSLFALKELDF